MAYSDSFSVQWDCFVADFIVSIKGYTAEMISTERLNDWYKTNSFRWSSIAENEGILLDHEKNVTLKNELLKELSRFSFSEVKLPSKPNVLPYLGVGIVAAGGLAAALKLLFYQSFFFVVIGATVGILAPVILYAKKLDNHNNKQGKMIVEGYSNQLTAYKEHLMRICKKFE